MSQKITLQINGQAHTTTISNHQLLLQVLREKFQLFGVREGCGVGMCGACTVLLDGKPVSSCLTLAVMAVGKEITTIEGLSRGDELHPVQQAFLDKHGFQCSYCTPGFILATVSLLADHPKADADTIREYLAGNLCRCGSYVNILQAVQQCVAEYQKESGQ